MKSNSDRLAAAVCAATANPGASGTEAYELEDDQVFLAGNPGGEILDGDALAALKLGAAIGRILADDAIQAEIPRQRTANWLRRFHDAEERGIYAPSPHECIETLENFEWPVYANVEAA